MEKDFEKYKHISLKCKIDKNTGKAELLNGEEVASFYSAGIELMGNAVKKADPDGADMLDMILFPIKQLFRNKTSVEAIAMRFTVDFLFPFGKEYKHNDTLKRKEPVPCPVSETENIEATNCSYISNRKLAKNTCELSIETSYDHADLRQMMKASIKKTLTAMGIEEAAMSHKFVEVDYMTIDIQEKQIMSLDYHNGWPIQTTKKITMIINDPLHSKKEEKLIEVTITYS